VVEVAPKRPPFRLGLKNTQADGQLNFTTTGAVRHFPSVYGIKLSENYVLIIFHPKLGSSDGGVHENEH
jgi:hypothetical protein